MLSWILNIFKNFRTKSIEPSSDKNKLKMSSKSHLRHLLELSTQEKLKFIKSFDIVLSDCDGVLWDIYAPIKHAGEAINQLAGKGKFLGFITNNSVRQNHEYEKKFKECGISVDMANVVHPLVSILEYLKNIKFKDLMYVIATTKFKDALREAGYQVIDGPNFLIGENFQSLSEHISSKDNVRAVIIDIDFNLSSVKILKAISYLKNPDCQLIIGSSDMKLPITKDVSILGPGPYVNILKGSSKNKSIDLGKPGKELCDIVIQKYKIQAPKRVLFIGDMLQQDIAFGKVGGFQTLLVLSGGTSKLELTTLEDQYLKPDYYADTIGDFVEFFKSIESHHENIF